jgi:hypothetical protein
VADQKSLLTGNEAPPAAAAAPPPETDALAADVVAAWPSVTWILAQTGIVDYSGIRNADYYLERGADVHLIAESISKGETEWWAEGELSGFGQAWKQFLADTGFKVEFSEYAVFHPVRRYRGTLDVVGHFPREKNTRTLIDIKSGIVADWTALQTAAYAACLPEPEKIRRIGLQLKANGSFRVTSEYLNYRIDSSYFFSLVNTVHGRSLYGKTILEEQP